MSVKGKRVKLNANVLEKLFGFVRRFDLKACRVVDKKWNIRTVPHIRSTFKVIIHGSPSINEYFPDRNTRRIDNFVELLSSNELGIPFTKFELGPFCTTEEVGQQFLQLCGETATKIDLKLDRTKVYTIEDVSELLRSCPNLEALDLPYKLISRARNVVKLFPDSIPTLSSLKDIRFASVLAQERVKCCPSFIEELMTAAPNISEIRVFDGGYRDGEDNSRNIKMLLNCIEKLGRESSIQTLFIGSTSIEDIEHLKRMAKKGLKLKSLSALRNNYTGDDLETNQFELATCFKDTLEYFNVETTLDNIMTEFPNMPNLKSFRQQIRQNFDIRPVNLNENFPVLETLNISFDKDEDASEVVEWDEFFSEFDPCPTVKSLIVEESYMKIHMFHNFLIIFPNLTKLDFQVRDQGVDGVRQIWTHMTQLESLTISCHIDNTVEFYLDSIFTGIPTRVLKSIKNVVDDLDKLTVEERKVRILRLRNDRCRLSSIRNLTNLKHLELKIHGNCLLNDFTAYLAFHSMNHLRHLDISQSQCGFTKACCEILTKETGLETWNFSRIFNHRILDCIIPPFLLPDRG